MSTKVEAAPKKKKAFTAAVDAAEQSPVAPAPTKKKSKTAAPGAAADLTAEDAAAAKKRRAKRRIEEVAAEPPVDALSAAVPEKEDDAAAAAKKRSNKKSSKKEVVPAAADVAAVAAEPSPPLLVGEEDAAVPKEDVVDDAAAKKKSKNNNKKKKNEPVVVPAAAQSPPPVVRAPPPPPPEYFAPARERIAPQSACDVRVDPDTDVLVLRTPQVGTLHNVFNAMRELMADVTMVVDRDRGTVSINGFDRIVGYCVDTVLRFEQQICRSPELAFSVPASSFYAMLTKAGPKHTVYMFVPQSSFVNGNVDYLHFQFETPPAAGGGAARIFTISLPTLNDPDPDHKFKLPPIAYPLRITLKSKQFGTDMRDLAEFGGENLQIEIRDGDCYFSSVLQTGATLGGRIHYPNICSAGDNSGMAQDSGAASAVVAPPAGFHFRDIFPLKNIKRIIKCGTLSTDVVIGICAGVPLNFYYPIGADLGDMNVYLAQSST